MKNSKRRHYRNKLNYIHLRNDVIYANIVNIFTKKKTKGIFNKRQVNKRYGYRCHVTGEFSIIGEFSDCKGSYKLDLDKLKNI